MGGRRSGHGRRRTALVAALATLTCLGLVSAASALELPARHDDSNLWAGYDVDEVSTASKGVPIDGGTRMVSLRIERHWTTSLHVGGSSPLPSSERASLPRWQFVITECGSPCWEDREQTWYGGVLADDMVTTTDAGDRRFTATAECGEIDVTWTSDPEDRQLPAPPPDEPGRTGLTLQESQDTHRGGPTGTACGYELEPHAVRITRTLDAGSRL